jgi:hypothetical protein
VNCRTCETGRFDLLHNNDCLAKIVIIYFTDQYRNKAIEMQTVIEKNTEGSYLASLSLPLVCIKLAPAFCFLFVLTAVVAREDELLSESLLFFSISIIAIALIPWKRHVEIDFFSAKVLFCIFYFIYIWIPAGYLYWGLDYRSNWLSIDHKHLQAAYNYTLASTIAGLIAFLVGHSVGSIHRRLLKPGQYFEVAWLANQWKKHRKHFRVPALALIAIGFYATLIVYWESGGASSKLLLRLSTGLGESVEISALTDALTSWLTWGVMLLLYSCLSPSRLERKWFLIAVILMVAIFVGQYLILSGKRSYVAPLIIFPAIWSHYLGKRYRIGKAFAAFAFMFLLMAVLVILRTIIPLLATGESSYINASEMVREDPISHYMNSAELALFDNVMICVEKRNEILIASGGWTNAVLDNMIAPALFAVPRILWPSKPVFKDTGMIVFKEYIGNEENVGFAVGVYGTAFLIGGPIAVIILFFVYGFVLARLYNRLYPLAGKFGSVFCYSVCLWIGFMFFRFGTIGFTAIYVYQRMFVAVMLSIVLLLFEHKICSSVVRHK